MKMKIHYGRIHKTDREETIVVSARKNLRIEQQRRTTRESVKERKEDDAQYVIN